SLINRSIGLLFEIDNDKVFAGNEHLAKVKVAVAANPHAGHFLVNNLSKTIENHSFELDNFCGIRPNVFRQSRQPFLQQGKRLISDSAEALIKRATIQRRERLRSKGGILPIRRKGLVGFAGSLTEETGGRQIGTR